MANATTATPSSIPAAPAEETIRPRRLVAFLIMVFGMFMAILDIQIVSASLADIQAGLSASSSEVAWVQTSYLIAEVIAIPMSGFLSRALGTRLLFALSASGFTLASIACGLTSTIDQMIVWRAIQGFVGAGMIPTVFASPIRSSRAASFTSSARSSALLRRWRRPSGRLSAATSPN